MSRVKFVGPRSGYSDDCGCISLFRRRVVLVLHSHYQVRAYVMDANIGPINLGCLDGLFCLLPTRTVGSTQLFQVILSRLCSILVCVLDFEACLMVRVQAIRQELRSIYVRRSRILLGVILRL